MHYAVAYSLWGIVCLGVAVASHIIFFALHNDIRATLSLMTDNEEKYKKLEHKERYGKAYRKTVFYAEVAAYIILYPITCAYLLYLFARNKNIVFMALDSAKKHVEELEKQ